MTIPLNSRFAEECRDRHLDLVGAENALYAESIQNRPLDCEKDIYIGLFFDGTNNNKYRDAPGYGHSNVARLYEIFPGAPAQQTPPELRPRIQINPDGSATQIPRSLEKEGPTFAPASVPAGDLPYYRKIYVPGLGTPHLDVFDNGQGIKKTGGLAMALLGQARIDWALLQLINQIHAAIFRAPIEPVVQIKCLKPGSGASRPLRGDDLSLLWMPMLHPLLVAAGVTVEVLGKLAKDWVLKKLKDEVGYYRASELEAQLKDYESRLSAALARRGSVKPTLRKIRLSVFGFSRGSAEARAWVNAVQRRWSGGRIAGIDFQIDFLGVFDTVASVGIAHSMPGFDGHAAWASGEELAVPPEVKRCVHLASAHEVRGSFPLDSVCQGGMLPPNCKEIIYPGVHSDVGGGYPPNEQGRSLGNGAAGDARKLSQLPLAQMYREARMAGVPLAPPSAMDAARARNFAVDAELKRDFNAYIAATRRGSVPPTQGKGEALFARMFPTETQPRENVHHLIRTHSAYMHQWRKSLLQRAGGIAGLPCMEQYAAESRLQDIEDLRGAEAELRKEVRFLMNPDPRKYDEIDEAPLLNFVFEHFTSVPEGSLKGAAAGMGAAAPTVNPLAVIAGGSSGAVLGAAVAWMVSAFKGLMREKQGEWNAWLSEDWFGNTGLTGDKATRVFTFYERYAHDSRAWFKALLRNDRARDLAPDDEDWFVLGGRERERRAELAFAQSDLQAAKKERDHVKMAAAQDRVTALQEPGQPLIRGGREPYRAWGYLRHRRVYESGVLMTPYEGLRQYLIDTEERARIRERMLSEENARHAAALQEIRDKNREVIQSGRLSDAQLREYNYGARFQIERENEQHAAAVIRISQSR